MKVSFPLKGERICIASFLYCLPWLWWGIMDTEKDGLHEKLIREWADWLCRRQSLPCWWPPLPISRLPMTFCLDFFSWWQPRLRQWWYLVFWCVFMERQGSWMDVCWTCWISPPVPWIMDLSVCLWRQSFLEMWALCICPPAFWDWTCICGATGYMFLVASRVAAAHRWAKRSSKALWTPIVLPFSLVWRWHWAIRYILCLRRFWTFWHG